MTRHAALSWLVRLMTAGGLGIDAGIHLDLASSQPPGFGGQLSQVDLFYFEAGAAILAAVLVLATGAWLAYAFAVLVAASALGAVVLYRYVNVGSIGPLPNMYEPFWYATKIATTVAEALALVTAGAGALRGCPQPRPGTASGVAGANTRPQIPS